MSSAARKMAIMKAALDDTLPVPFEGLLDAQLLVIREMLLAKNQAYGNSALDPLRCFSKADAVEQIKVRIDDKLSRLMRGSEAGEDVILDLIGYLVLLRIAGRGGAAAPPRAPGAREVNS